MTTNHGIASDDWTDLHRAVQLLEHPGLAARLTSLIGSPIEEGLKLLPPTWHDQLRTVTERIVTRSLDTAISTLNLDRPGRSAPLSHRNLGMLTGACGGYFGLPGTLLEMPLTTMLMLRSIAAVAADEGENLRELPGRLACVETLALGGRVRSDDAADTGYYGVKVALAFHFSAVSEAMVRQGVAVQTLPGTVNLVRAVAARFGIAITDKAALQMVPIAGAVGGAMLNAIFIDHFQDMARGHFIIRRLERRYGDDTIEKAYTSIAARADGAGSAGGQRSTTIDAV
ncbi:MAG: EcsC family protein [Gammaproteobacteria bacterium]|nr:EcsC family protein [Gammaproteobacteria bacterium]